jgi:hypothetical protein
MTQVTGRHLRSEIRFHSRSSEHRPHSLVSVSEAGWFGSVGYTDASGLFWLNGIVGSNVVGTWQQTWTIGGVVAQPSPLQFTITPKP